MCLTGSGEDIFPLSQMINKRETRKQDTNNFNRCDNKNPTKKNE